MTHQQKIEAIRAACIVANPEIVELKFGCVIRMTGTKQPDYIKTPVPITSVKPMSDGCWEVPWGCFHPVSNKKEYIIIGRPIRLADIILIAKKVGYNTTQEWFKVLGSITDKWNLRQDDLTLQDKPTIDFIHDLLK